MEKPFSQACENNRQPILSVLQTLFTFTGTVLEIGSGTGQHAVYFASAMPHVTWQTSDLAANHGGIRSWLSEFNLANTPPPLEMDVRMKSWPGGVYDAVFSANTLHIMHWDSVMQMLGRVADIISIGGLLVVYGPFNYGNRYTSDSNARFDAWLKQQDPGSGIRNYEDVNGLLADTGMILHSDTEMPANNRLLCWQKSSR